MTAPTLETERELAAAIGLGGIVVGVDEVGRGALAGPVAVGAVALDPSGATIPAGLRDSKLLSQARREALQPALAGWGAARAVGLATAAEVDGLGIVAALGRAGARALAALGEAGIPMAGSVVLLDGSHDWLTSLLPRGARVVTRIKADRDCAVVSAASVLAKVHRDRMMATADVEHPGYDWAGNKGYGSPGHIAAIRSIGPSPLHRMTFLRGILTTP